MCVPGPGVKVSYNGATLCVCVTVIWSFGHFDFYDSHGTAEKRSREVDFGEYLTMCCTLS